MLASNCSPALALALLTAACGSAGQRSAAGPPAESANWVVEQFYARPAFPEKAAHLGGEFEFAAHYAQASTMGEQLPPSVRVVSRALMRGDTRAVFATTLRDSAEAQDWYTYLAREGGVWKITAVRTLALPPFVRTLRNDLRAMRPRPDSLDARLRNLELTMQSDSALRAYFAARRDAFDALAAAFGQLSTLRIVRSDGTAEPGASPAEARAVVAQLRALDLNAISRAAGPSDACVRVSVGGILDNDVGFLRVGPGCPVPPMTPQEYIYVEPVAPGWVIYKTT
jgi:hypothetical protein